MGSTLSVKILMMKTEIYIIRKFNIPGQMENVFFVVRVKAFMTEMTVSKPMRIILFIQINQRRYLI